MPSSESRTVARDAAAVLSREQEREEHLSRLIQAGLAMAAERDHDVLVERILLEAKALGRADGGTLYLRDEAGTALRFAILRNDSLNLAMGGSAADPVTFPLLRMETPDGRPNYHNVCTAAALSGHTINIPDAYESEAFDFSGTRRFDAGTGYRSQSFLTIPLRNHTDEVIGVLQLINAMDEHGTVVPFSREIESLVEALAAQAAIALDNQTLMRAQRDLLDALIKIMAGAIDAKSPYTSGHCERVPAIAKLMAEAACSATDGPYAEFGLDEAEWYELHVAAYLHDCGKVTTPEYVMDKATKLEIIHNRIHEVRVRFEVLRRDAEIAYWRTVAEGADEAEARATRDAEIARLDDDFTFVATCNIGGEFMSPEHMARVRCIGDRPWVRHFDRTAGLSWQERHRQAECPPPPPPAVEPLLSNRPDHRVDGYDFGEIYNLCISRGTIAEEERQKINDHIVVTQRMLDQMPFPRHLARVPEIAGNHHEKMDGTGYPRGLRGEDMSPLARMMAIADVFEALTASDRPYKKPKTLNESVRILSLMVQDDHIDPDLFELFLSGGVHTAYAEMFLQPEQVDGVDVDAYLRIAREARARRRGHAP
ncbi:HD domain-containing phosphohydrolase [Roseospira visakhapatnamensis]|uniref:HD-GYP domain-containing protein (C-di-GMP phosphodiesterase class II) n=1 Tax=Roseospira visakhapatnamensis TaxID=390880 RepID=A0A7W6REZ6_9PROT|nr:HD domain-containing phosphohydrolase [Roseospira visakhapatnamensis]MBB4266713.1 HD-GYP domain-containing protein (c-di-GMP phosphodiesterase class II) [Roseospira visakhapatnamensis]